MKKLLLIASAAFISAGAFAQSCTPDASYANSSAGLYPAGPLGPTCELIAPKTIVSLTDTSVANPLGGTVQLYITRMKVTNVVGLPAGLELSTDVMASADVEGPWGYYENTGTIPNQTSAFGCAYVHGAQSAWDAAIGGGPLNDGEYPVEFFVDAYIEDTDNPSIEGLLGIPTWVSGISPSFGGGEFVIFDTLVVESDYADLNTTITGSANVDPLTPYSYATSSVPNATYVWTAVNGTIVDGQGTSSVLVEWAGSGSIAVDVTDDACSGSDQTAVTSSATGLDEIAGINASVYPNPSNGVFNLQLDNTDALTVRIMDVSGKVIRTNSFSGSTLYTVDMQTAPVGVYILELETATGKTFKRLIKQ